MNTLLKTSLALVAFVSLLSVATFSRAGTGIGARTGHSISNNSGYVQSDSSVNTQSYRAYSYEPAPALKAGDTAVVTKAKAEVKVGDRVVATVPKGTQFTVVAVQETWIGATVDQNGQKVSGWIASADLAIGPAAPAVPSDRELIEKQKICPVSDAALGSMGAPVKVTVKDRIVFLCCEGCKAKLLADPDKYLAKLDKQNQK